MKIKQDIKVTVDAVLFGYQREEGVSVLLIKRKIDPFKGQWAIPGGFVLNGESPEQAVHRELAEETGVKINYLEQLYTFGEPDRDPRMQVISIAYYGLVKPEIFQLSAATDASEAAWFNIKKLPKLAFDHKKILQRAVERLRGKITYEPIGFELLPSKFPFSDLEQLYMTLLDRDIDRRNFKRKMMSLGVVVELNEKAPVQGAGRPGNLFQFDKQKYFQLKKQGFLFDLNT